jgi:hypothetical protein
VILRAWKPGNRKPQQDAEVMVLLSGQVTTAKQVFKP